LASDIWYGTSGPRSARIVVVGESWGWEEQQARAPFVGQSGQELRRMIAEAGLDPDECFYTNVVPERPDGNEMWRFFSPTKGAVAPFVRGLYPLPNVVEGLRCLHEQLRAIKPLVVVACGNYALWALTNCTSWSTPAEAEGRRVPSGIMQWRGSQWYCDAVPDLATLPLVPLIHPAAILRAWYNRAVTVHDLRERVCKQGLARDWRGPKPQVHAPPTFEHARSTLIHWINSCNNGNKLRLMNDIETARGLMTCIGFADSPQFAMSIPFIRTGYGQPFESYWTYEEEKTLVKLIRTLLSHPNCLVEGQNYLYDIQYIQKFLGCTPQHAFDSMLAHHLLFPGTPKGLDYLSSLYCKYHWYWKEDHKEWDMRGSIEQLLQYNALDCLKNFEINTVLKDLIPKLGQEAQWAEEMEKNSLALEMMNRGIRIDTGERGMFLMNLCAEADSMAFWFNRILPQEFVSPDAGKGVAAWWQSPHQQRRFFGTDLGFNLPTNRKTDRKTFNGEALTQLGDRHPEFIRLFEALELFRSIRVFTNTFVRAELDDAPGGSRMRCMFNTAGTETFRWSSSENAFGRGTNLQNIPKGEED